MQENAPCFYGSLKKRIGIDNKIKGLNNAIIFRIGQELMNSKATKSRKDNIL
jgi:hypothetical protein